MGFSSTDCFLILGTRGTGKSFLGKRIQRIWPRRVIIDPLQEYTDNSGKPIFPGATVVNNFREFSEKLISLENKKKFVLIFQFDPEERQNDGEVFEEICRLCWYFGNIQVVFEEVQMHATTHQLPHWLKQLLLTGRHRNVSLLFTSQRPGEVHKTIVSQCNHIFAGRIIEGNDLRYVANFLNQSTKRLTELPDRRFLWRSPGGIREIENDF